MNAETFKSISLGIDAATPLSRAVILCALTFGSARWVATWPREDTLSYAISLVIAVVTLVYLVVMTGFAVGIAMADLARQLRDYLEWLRRR